MSEPPDPGSAPTRKPYTAKILAALSDRQEIIATTQHPQRDQQFRYIRRVKQIFINAGYPVISVDTKKKELIGNFKNAGQTWNSPEVLDVPN